MKEQRKRKETKQKSGKERAKIWRRERKKRSYGFGVYICR